MLKEMAPYLHFKGEAAQAAAFYEATLGARVDALMRWGEMPGQDLPPELADHVMHGCMHIGDHQLNMSDVPPQFYDRMSGNGHILLEFEDADELERRFHALAEGGEVTMPLEDTFWNARYGELRDRFGVHWKFNCQR